MTTEQIWLAVLGAVALAALLLAVLALGAARRALRVLADEQVGRAAEPPTPDVAGLGSGDTGVADTEAEHAAYVITGLRTEAPRTPAPERIEGRLFADIVAREALVKAASWGHGLRRALAPESRNRIRFEVRQQARRARKDRKVEQREALREYRARRGLDDRDEDAA